MDMETAVAAGGAGLTGWQAAALSGAAGWVWAASYFDLTRRTRALAQPWVIRHVHAETPAILRFQRMQHRLLDNFFSVLSCVVSVPFYTGFLPLLFWSGHGKLARQMTLLMAFSDYLGNVVKDVVSAPRPCSPPVRRVTATQDEKEHAMEYGLPSSHALMTVCLMGYMLHYVLSNGACDSFMITAGLSVAFLQVLLIGIARVYLGMHSLTDVIAGICLGVVILAFWLVVDDHVDAFVVSGQNVTFFWACLSSLLCFAYPEPEFPTPSFEFHTAFTGVAFGIVYGVQQTYSRFHGPDAALILSQQLPLLAYVGRVLVGIPTILVVKSCSKALSKWLLPVMCSTLGVPIVSSCYVPALKAPGSSSSKSDPKQVGYLQKVFSLFPRKAYDVDTGIRFVQYAGLAWSVVDLVPVIFTYLNL
uniref:Uncharacterized protein n=1 Tax=Avena sativa TaxID=4498 RepID=A0ACD6A759_AVESA